MIIKDSLPMSFVHEYYQIICINKSQVEVWNPDSSISLTMCLFTMLKSITYKEMETGGEQYSTSAIKLINQLCESSITHCGMPEKVLISVSISCIVDLKKYWFFERDPFLLCGFEHIHTYNKESLPRLSLL